MVTSVRLVLYIHLLSVAFWLGSQLFMIAVVLPAMRGTDAVQRRETFRRVGRQYGVVSVPILLVLLVSGVTLATHLHLDPASSAVFRDKLIAVAVVLVATVVHGVAEARQARRIGRSASVVVLAATLAAAWFATGL